MRSSFSSLSSQNESAKEELEIPGFAVRSQIMIVNGLSFSGLKMINTFLNGYSYLYHWLNHFFTFNRIRKSFEKRFLRVIETINDENIARANKKLFNHLNCSGLCTRLLFKNIFNCENDLDKVIKKLGLPISAKLNCTECDAFKYIK